MRQGCRTVALYTFTIGAEAIHFQKANIGLLNPVLEPDNVEVKLSTLRNPICNDVEDEKSTVFSRMRSS